MSILLWAIATPFVLLGAYIIFLNWFRHVLMARHLRRTGQRRFISGVPLLGPVLVSLAWLVAFFDARNVDWRWVWIPWVIDEGTWSTLYALTYWCVLRPLGVRNIPGFREYPTPKPPTTRSDPPRPG